jgi:hypothetical protein
VNRPKATVGTEQNQIHQAGTEAKSDAKTE